MFEISVKNRLGQILLILSISVSFAQNRPIDLAFDYQITSITNGLNSSNILSLFQDSNGFIWVGTDSGVSKYNGISFHNFTHAQSESLGMILSILEDNNGVLWVAGTNGLFYFKNGKFQKLPIVQNDIQVIKVLKDKFWVGGYGFVPFSLSYEDLEALKNKQKINIKSIVEELEWNSKVGRLLVRDIEMDRDGTIWLAAFNKRVSYDNSGLQIHWQGNKDEEQDQNVIKEVGKDSLVWGSEDAGLFLQRGRNFKKITEAATYIVAQKDSDTYILTTQELILLTSGKLNKIHVFNKYANLYFKTMIVDLESNIWIGAEGNLLKLTPNFIKRWSFEQEPLLHSTHSIVQLSTKKILIGSSKENILTIHNDSINIYNQIKVPHNSFTAAILEDKNHDIWYGTSMGGLVLERNGIEHLFSEKNGLGDKGQYCLFLSDEGSIWTGGEHGISKIYRNENDLISFKNFMLPKFENITTHFKSIFQSTNGLVWAAGNHGLYKVVDDRLDKWEFENLKNTRQPVITEALVDLHQNLWLSTQDQGVWQCKFDTNHEPRIVRRWTKQNGLPSSVILDILVDQEMLWIASQNNLCSIDISLGISSLNCIDKSAGWFKEPTPHVKLMKSANDYLWCVGLTELLAIPVDNLKSNKVSPNAFIDDVALIDSKEDINYYTKDLSKTQVLPQNLKLPHNENALSFKFGSTSYRQPQRNKYRYRLLGLDTKWNGPVKNNEIFYTGLKPGDYTMEVFAFNNDGLASNSPALFSFTILSPWYASTVSYILLILLLIGSLYWFYRFQLSKKLAIAEKNKMEELSTLKNTLYTNITHEFRTPLTVILGLTQSIRDDLKGSNNGSIKDSMAIIERNGKNLLILVNQLLGLSKADSGNLKLSLVHADIVPFLRYVCQSFESLAAASDIEIMKYVELDQLEMDFDDGKLQIIISNILSNAIKFSSRGDRIVFHVCDHQIDNRRCLVIKVKDYGVGIPSDSLTHIFDRFYQAKNSPTGMAQGTGIGLAIVKELLDLMDGKINVTSIIDKGSEFIIHLPIEKNVKATKKTFNIDTKYEYLIDSKNLTPELFNSSTNVPLALIIEDNPDVAYYLKLCLKDKYNCQFAYDGQSGLELAFKDTPDIVICDLMMPILNGHEVCKILKKDERTDHIPIIILTAKSSKNERLLSLKEGADAFLTKPFLKDELLTRLDQLVLIRQRMKQRFMREDAHQILSSKETDPQINFLKKVIQIIHDQIDHPKLGSTSLSEKLNLSESQLYRKLKATTDKSTALFIRSVRLQKAKELIANTDMTISEISYAVGFNDPSWFTRAFKSEFGVTPSTVSRSN